MKRSSSPQSSQHSPSASTASEPDSHNKRQKINSSTHSSSSYIDIDSMGTVVLPYIHDILQNFELGHYDQCLKGAAPPELEQLSSQDRQSLNAIEDSLKALVERHVRLETENLRYQVALRQQQQLLHGQLETHPDKEAPAASSLSPPPKPSSKEKHSVAPASSVLPATPEDGMWSVKDASVLDKVKTKSHVYPPLSLSGYFCKFSVYSHNALSMKNHHESHPYHTLCFFLQLQTISPLHRSPPRLLPITVI
jgi:hypothetical protein